MISLYPLIDGPIVLKQPYAARGAKCFLLDGEILTAPERKKILVEQMANALVANDAYASQQDAIRMLHYLGFGSLNVALLAKEAFDLARRFVETQDMVAREIMDNAT